MSGLLIVNPRASGVHDALVEQVRDALPGRSRSCSPSAAVMPGRSRTRTSEDVDAIYVFSGDGTYNEVLNGVTSEIPLGFVPGGGTSVLPRALGLPRDPVGAARPSRERRRPGRSGSAG